MSKSCSYLITDCETGGLDDRLNPLLSVSLLAANDQFEALDNFELKIKPPPGTLLEVPIPAHQNVEIKSKQIAHYMDVHTGQLFTKQTKPQDALLINAIAAEINGYVEVHDGAWNFDTVKKWNEQGVTLESADHSFVVFVLGHFAQPAVGVAHNADFDSKFVSRYLPKLFSNYYRNDNLSESSWFCTVKAFRLWRKKTGIKGAAKLGDLAEQAGHKPNKAHAAFDDCYSCLAGLKWLNTQHEMAE